ncbi:MAG: biotin synthase, partial [Eubacterium sp.]
LYQADWLLRFYGFSANELLDAENPNFSPLVDPKCSWALSHMETFPIEINKASKAMLLRVPGIGVKSAMRIVKARRTGTLDFSGLKKMGVVLKRAQYFILCNGKMMEGLKVTPDGVLRALISEQGQKSMVEKKYEQLTFFDQNQFPVLHKEVMKCLTQ